MRERISRARQAKNLQWNVDSQKAIDIITASGLSDALGSALTRLKDLGQVSAYPDALNRLCEAIGGQSKINTLICRQSIYEWLQDKCETCAGRGNMRLPNGVNITCHACAGVKVRRWTDGERALSIGVPVPVYRREHMATLNRALARIDAATRIYANGVKYKLSDEK